MSKTKNKPGIHLYCGIMSKDKPNIKHYYKGWYWHIVAKNGRIVARSSKTYTRKSGAVKSIKIAANIFRYEHPFSYFDHSLPDIPKGMYYNK